MEYIGRNRLDGATLDRFIIIDVDYDEKLEKKLTDNNRWYSIVNKIRDNAEKNGIKVIISPRACMDGADLLDAGFTYEEAIDMTIIKGNSEDVKKKLLNGVKIPTKVDKQEEPFEEAEQPDKEKKEEYADMEFWFDERDDSINAEIEWGDWKHDHAYLDYLMKEWGYEKTNEITTESDGSDCYSAEHYFVKK